MPDGHVEMRWQVSPEPEATFSFAWREMDGPTVVSPAKQGFGSKLLDRSLAMSLGAKIELRYDPAGVIFSIAGPVAALSD